MNRSNVLPLGAGPPMDDSSGDELDTFAMDEGHWSDEEQRRTLRRKPTPEPEEEIPVPEFLLKKSKPKNKKLDFGAGCTRGATRYVKPPTVNVWTPAKSGKLGSTLSNAGPCTFDKKTESQKFAESVEGNKSAMEALQQCDAVPSGSYEQDRRWLVRLEKLWSEKSGKDTRPVTEMLAQIFTNVGNPFLTALYLIEGAKDYKQIKTYTLSMTVAKEFEKWAKVHGAEEAPHCLNEQIKLAALQVAIGGNLPHLLDILVTSFAMRHPDNHYFLRLVQPFIEQQKYKEAAQCVSRLGLHSHYALKDICIPLLLQDKLNLVEMYVYQEPDAQLQLLQYIDSLLDEDIEIDDVIGSFKRVPDKRLEKLEPRPLHKLGVRLMKLYQIEDELCPNISTRRSTKAVRYLLYKRYLEKTLSPEQFEELVQTSIGDSVTLQEKLVDGLIDYVDIEEALRWALFYQLPVNQIPSQVASALEEGVHLKPGFKPIRALFADPSDSSGEEDDSVESPHYRSPRMTSQMIQIVDTVEGFNECMEHICSGDYNVGIDAEWRPSFGQSAPTRLSLIQLATPTRVFILDVLALSQSLAKEHWIRFARDFLGCVRIIKLGYGISSDLSMLSRAFTYLHKYMQNLQGIVDLQVCQEFLTKIHPEIFQSRQKSSKNAPYANISNSSENDVSKNETNDKNETKYEEKNAKMEESGQNIGQNKTKSGDKVVKKEERGLSELVRICMGKPLSKKEQISDWERRPLRNAQLQYAALDAMCLVDVFEFLERRVRELGLNLDLRSGIKRSHYTSKKSKSEKRQQRVKVRKDQKEALSQMPNPGPVTGKQLPVSDFRVVVDNMLQGLGKQLRACGADVRMLANNDRHEMAGRIAQTEDRVILTSGMPFATLRSCAPLGMCYNVAPGTAKQQVKQVLKHFNVKVTPEDLFSRCQVCNGNEYCIISPAEMTRAWHRHQQLNSQSDFTTSRDVTTSGTTSTSGINQQLNSQSDPTSSHDVSTSETSSISGLGGTSGINSDYDVTKVDWKPLGRGSAWQGVGTNITRGRGRGILAIQALPSLAMVGLSREQPAIATVGLSREQSSLATGLAREKSQINSNVAQVEKMEEDKMKSSKEKDVKNKTNEILSKSRTGNKDEKMTTSSDEAEEVDPEMSLEEFMSLGSDSGDESLNSGSSLDQINMDTITVGDKGVKVQVDTIPEPMLKTVKLFYVCSTCGKVFWEGSHFAKVKKQFEHVFTDTYDDNAKSSVYSRQPTKQSNSDLKSDFVTSDPNKEINVEKEVSSSYEAGYLLKSNCDNGNDDKSKESEKQADLSMKSIASSLL